SADDRLCPTQDTMPPRGPGNLIALPLQREPRQHGNTVFVDDGLVPYADQWAYLAALRRITSSTVEAIAEEAMTRGQVIGLPIAQTGDDGDGVPRGTPPTRPARTAPNK